MNFLELQDEVKDWINFTSGTSNSDFTSGQIKKAVNQAYKREVRKGRLEGGSSWFLKNVLKTWPASTATLEVPSVLNQTNALRIEDITDTDPGFDIGIAENGTMGEIFWLDNRTLQWGEDGPSSARSLRWHYMARAVDLVNDAEIPDLIPEDFHELLVLSAGVFLRFKADEMAPQEWQSALNDLRMDYWKELTLGRPRSTGSAIRRIDPFEDFDAPAQDRSSIATDNNS